MPPVVQQTRARPGATDSLSLRAASPDSARRAPAAGTTAKCCGGQVRFTRFAKHPRVMNPLPALCAGGREVLLPRVSNRRIWFARINLRAPSLFDRPDFGDSISDVLSGGTETNWYNRTWILSRPIRSGGYVQGRLGFERPTPTEGVHFDRTAQDFVTTEERSEQGSFAHYVINVRTRVMAFEERPPDIRRESFLGAMRRILGGRGFELDDIADNRSFDSFVASVDAISRYDVRLVRANPSASRRARDTYNAIFVEPDPDSVTLTLASDTRGERAGIDVSSDVVQGTAAHALDSNGKIRVTGYMRSGARRFWDSARHLLQGSIQVSRDDPAEVVQESIRELLEELAPASDNEEREARGDHSNRR